MTLKNLGIAHGDIGVKGRHGHISLCFTSSAVPHSLRPGAVRRCCPDQLWGQLGSGLAHLASSGHRHLGLLVHRLSVPTVLQNAPSNALIWLSFIRGC